VGVDVDRSGVSAAWGVVAVVLSGAAVATWLAAAPHEAAFPAWPAWVLSALTVAAIYLCFASLFSWWPARATTGDLGTNTSNSGAPGDRAHTIGESRGATHMPSQSPEYAHKIAAPDVASISPTKDALLRAVMNFADIEDPEFRRQILRSMGDYLGLGRPFSAPYRPMAVDHVAAIIDRCWDFKDPSAARCALVQALNRLRPDDGAAGGLPDLI
jgi:hypothetical protein